MKKKILVLLTLISLLVGLIGLVTNTSDYFVVTPFNHGEG
ncbi:putative membrane protein [Paenibacillus riograndensis SBR5]|uniref:Putative membrane protein n=1 Tax=Paenibacillus riograndensis SBR5 TaxID=1073571 RepID=A0A0E4HHK8_9BACL|nr:putative membrane protein [Paenibacillus riograndensis SBR5]